jgi:hypothetical protein
MWSGTGAIIAYGAFTQYRSGAGAGLRQSASTGTQMTQMEKIRADYSLDLQQSTPDLRQSAFYFSTLT